MARISKTERILNLVSFLLKSPVPIPWAEIKGKVVGYDDRADVSTLERRFERDKEFLRALGIPFQYTSLDRFGNSGYFIEKADYYLPKMEITPEDVAAISLVSRLSLRDIGPLRDALQSALRKIQIDFPAPFEIAAEAEEREIKAGDAAPVAHNGSEDLDVLLHATLNSKRVRFHYYTMGRDSTSERQIEPYGMGFTRGAWYLVGWCLARRDIRVFKINRIKGRVRIAHEGREGPDFQTPADFKLDDHIGKPAWQMQKGEPVKVEVRFDPAIAWMAVEAIDAADSPATSPDGSALVTMRVTAVEPFIRWVLSFGQHATVVSPAWLRDRICSVVRGVADIYRR